MPVSAELAESNRVQPERLRKLVGRLTADMRAVRLPRGWTVAVALAHMAFWDRQRLCLMRRWAAGDMCNGGYDGALFNEVLLPFLEMIPPEQAAAAALQSAEEVDLFLLTVPDEVVELALARPDRPNLDRGAHREYHLERIELALAEAGFASPDGVTPDAETEVYGGFIPKDARWYLADVVMEHRIEAEPRNVVHVNTHLIEADNPDVAYEKALTRGRDAEHEYKNTDHRLVQVVFRGLRELNVIHERLEDGAEIMYSEETGVSEEQLRKWAKPRDRLGVFAPLRNKLDGPNYVPVAFKVFKLFLEEIEGDKEGATEPA